MKTMFELAEKLKELKEVKSTKEDEVKTINAEIEQTEKELTSLMISEETQSFKRSGTLFYLNTKTYASAIAEQKENLCEALKTNGFGSLVYETINANSLSAFTKEQMEDNDDKLPQWLDGLVNVYEKPAVSLRKSTSKF